ncbi:MAG: TatD family hydrolase [Deltaproteobacteria bacterium]|nr:TatD family hydrolase [Deltaproteobacteria bacterium]
MIDAHCHLYSGKYDHDLPEVIHRAQEKLQAVIISAVDLESLKKSLAIRRKYHDFIYLTAGVHPRNAAKLNNDELSEIWQAIRNVEEEIVAVGEVGPDFYHIKDPRLRQRQLSVLEDAMAQAVAMDLPLVIHARQAEKAALEVVSRCPTPVLFHCFAGTRQMARKITDHGFYLSFSAILLFSSELQRTATEIPLELILTETDSPALSPRRSQQRNEPAFLETIVSRLASLFDYPVDRMGSITAANAIRFYGLADL